LAGETARLSVGELSALRLRVPRGKPDSNERLLEALRQVGDEDTPRARADVVVALTGATLIVPVLSDDPSASGLNRTADGLVVLPTYTSAERLRQMRGESRFTRVPAVEVFRTALTQGVDRVTIDAAQRGRDQGKATAILLDRARLAAIVALVAPNPA
jgi:type III secretion system (T3SS) SseB-like protein